MDNRPAIRGILRRALPLGGVMLLLSLNTNIPRYFLDSQLGTASLGIFAAVASPLAVGLLVVSALGQSASPRLARFAHDQNWHGFRRLLGHLMTCGSLLGIAGVLIALIGGDQILRIAFSPDYAAYAPVLVWLAIATGMGYVASFLGYAMTALRQFKVQLPLVLTVSGAIALCSWYWVPQRGLLGAAFATVAAALVQLTGSGLVIARELKWRANVASCS